MSWRPLHSACAVGNLDAVTVQSLVSQSLVSQSAAIDTSDNDGYQSLHLACENGHLHIVQWLVSQGAAVDTCANEEVQPLHYASSYLDI